MFTLPLDLLEWFCVGLLWKTLSDHFLSLIKRDCFLLEFVLGVSRLRAAPLALLEAVLLCSRNN